MKTFAGYVFVAIWFFHLLIGAVALSALIRLWPERRIDFVRFTAIHLTAAAFDALGAVIALLLAKDVKFTWKFSVAVFSFMLLRDVARIPLIVYILKPKNKDTKELERLEV